MSAPDIPLPGLDPAVLPLRSAPAAPGHFDELFGAATPVTPNTTDGTAAQPARRLNPVWARFFAHLGTDDLARRNDNLQRQLRDNGVTYNVYADASAGLQRPWALDLLPLIVSPQDWAQIEAGVVQRARLLDAMMADLYGPRTLLQRALLPAALVQGHPGYLRPMLDVRPPGGTWLPIVALDLAHGPDGRWSVVGQRTQAPSGLGYLLENRIAVSRQFPHAFAGMKVQRLAASYRALMEGLQSRLPEGENARIALLTPGPYNETYFEHAYLARYLGLTLVEGSDLTVRDQRLYLKTLQGLEPVHALIKRLDDEWLDPLELRADSTLGVPGLLQVLRAGNLLMANMPGSAPLESSALLGFLPAISEHLLGEPLRLPSLATWWCGEEAALREVLPLLPTSVIRPTYPNARMDTVMGRSLDERALDEWAGRIARHPEDYTVQAWLPLSQTPTWTPDGLGACRTLGVESEKVPQRGQFLPDSPPHSGTMGQEAGKKWAAAAHSQPTIPKSDRLLGARLPTGTIAPMTMPLPRRKRPTSAATAAAATHPDAAELRPGQSIALPQELHLLTREGRLNQDARRKLKQIYHLYQFIEPLLQECAALGHDPAFGPTLADLGAGKSYLGFILYDLYFKELAACRTLGVDSENAPQRGQFLPDSPPHSGTMGQEAGKKWAAAAHSQPTIPKSDRLLGRGWVYGIETRPELVEKSRSLAQRLGFERMRFLNLPAAASAQSAELPARIDIVTALHACDTATDDAIDFGLQKQARAMVLVPCCQAEVAACLRHDKAQHLARTPLAELWRHPLHTREFGSQLTNVLRCLRLEASGYHVTVTELVGWEHSLKNELIIARHTGQKKRSAAERLHAILAEFGLETALGARFGVRE